MEEHAMARGYGLPAMVLPALGETRSTLIPEQGV